MRCLAVSALHTIGWEANPGFIKRAIEKIAGTVSREHPAGAIAAVRRGRKADDQQARARIAEGGTGLPQ